MAGKKLTPVKPGAMVVTVKAVFEVKDQAEVENMLDELRGQGAVVSTVTEYVMESYAETVEIMRGAK